MTINLTEVLNTGQRITQKMLDGGDVLLNICNSISSYYGKTVDEVCKVTRKADVIRPRQMIHFFLWLTGKYSLTTIGEIVGKKDHATVLWGRDRVRDLNRFDIEVKFDVNELYKKLGHYLCSERVNSVSL
jgi:chromosomal replication initiation ATPase DnaA